MVEKDDSVAKPTANGTNAKKSEMRIDVIKNKARDLCGSIGRCYNIWNIIQEVEKYDTEDMKRLFDCKNAGSVQHFFVEKALEFENEITIEKVMQYIDLTETAAEKTDDDAFIGEKNEIPLNLEEMKLNAFSTFKEYQEAYNTKMSEGEKAVFDEIFEFKDDNENFVKFKEFFNKFSEFDGDSISKFRNHLVERKVSKDMRRLEILLNLDYTDHYMDYKEIHKALMKVKEIFKAQEESLVNIFKVVKKADAKSSGVNNFDYHIELKKKVEKIMAKARDDNLTGNSDDVKLSIINQKVKFNNTEATPLSYLCQFGTIDMFRIFAEIKKSDSEEDLIPRSQWTTSVFQFTDGHHQTNGSSGGKDTQTNGYSALSMDIDMPDKPCGGPTPIHCAAMNPTDDILKYLHDKELVNQEEFSHFSLKTTDKEHTPLHYAAYCGRIKCVDYLLSHNADFTLENSQGETPLHWAATGGDLRTFNHIYRKHVDEENCLRKEAHYGPPLLYAAKNRQFDCIGAILDKEDASDATVHDEDCDTTLHYISKDASKEWLSKVLKANALLGEKNEVGNAPIDWISKKRLEDLLDSHTYLVRLKRTEDTSRKDYVEVMFSNIFGHHASGSDMQNIKAIAEAPNVQDMCLHPLCQAIVSVKWQKIKKFFLLKLLFFVPFVFFLSMHPILSMQNEKLMKENETSGNVTQEEFDVMADWIDVSYIILKVLLTLQIFFGLISVFVMIPPFVKESRAYMQKFNLRRVRRLFEYYCEVLLWSDWYEYMLWVVALMYIFSDISPILVVVVSWFSMFYVCSNHPTILPLRYMLFKILLRYFKFFIFSFGLIGGFALGFFLLANKCLVNGLSCVGENSGFESLYTTALKVPSMMMGEISFETFNFESSPYLQFLFGSFIFLMTCCMFNMMNGLAINITFELEQKSRIFSTIAQCEMIYEFEILLHEVHLWLKWLRIGECRTLDSLWVERIKVKPSTGECENLEEIHGPITDYNVEDFFETNNGSKASWVWVKRGYTMNSRIILDALDRCDESKNVYRDPADVEIDFSHIHHDENEGKEKGADKLGGADIEEQKLVAEVSSSLNIGQGANITGEGINLDFKETDADKDANTDMFGQAGDLSGLGADGV